MASKDDGKGKYLASVSVSELVAILTGGLVNYIIDTILSELDYQTWAKLLWTTLLSGALIYYLVYARATQKNYEIELVKRVKPFLDDYIEERWNSSSHRIVTLNGESATY